MTNTLKQIPAWDEQANLQVDRLLEQEGIQRDKNLDYTCGIFDAEDNLIATGSCFGNTLRCIAVDSNYQGQGLMKQTIGHLVEFQRERGNEHIFLYTKVKTAPLIARTGFYEIERVGNDLVFMENHADGFEEYCDDLAKTYREGERIAGIVMNANPFTNGHLHLVTTAAAANDVLHLFIVSEDVGPIPAAVRGRLVRAGVAHLPNVICHDAGPYIISAATFPSYFLKEDDLIIRTQATLDLQVFGRIAKKLGIQRRYVGEERSSHVTNMYNQAMARMLPEMGLEFIEIPRLHSEARVISASTVRQAIHDNNLDSVREMLPPTTYAFFAGPEGAAVCDAIRAEKDVIHY